MAEQGIIVIKHVLISLMIAVGLISNMVGFVSTYRVPVGFPATRMLIRLQFIWDELGIIVIGLYWISFQINIPLNILESSLFTYVWSSYYVAALPIALSAINMALLAVDRYWAIVWFRTYRRNSKHYRIALVAILLTWTILLTSPIIILGHFMVHEHQIGLAGLNIIRKTCALIGFLFSFLITSLLVCATQVHIFLVVRGKKNGTRIISTSSENSEDDNMTTLSISLIIIVVLFIVTRISYNLGYLLTQFGIIPKVDTIDWKTDIILLIPVNFCSNPLVLLFTTTGYRKWLIGNIKIMAVSFRKLLSRERSNPSH
ncbi:hypothetical protein FBUS_02285 [Fasciolopsis buskii]|uniref:G-protein coupled receptors family 1 profile domain-containing protein n=1 Tax=Fasciolopsis buskii TaxID=27845 RepID=A0A8E0RZS3_9TREM|nr:hypothetical protein FBUS_02285 [Fasciolopsis buski]